MQKIYISWAFLVRSIFSTFFKNVVCQNEGGLFPEHLVTLQWSVISNLGILS